MNPSYISEIGRVLQHAREELGLSLPQASTALHIRAHYLQALETGELTVLPGAAYTKGYLQSYASFLRLDRDELVRRFERMEDDLPERGLFFPQVFSNEKKPSNSMIWGGVFLALVVYLAWYVAFRPAQTTSLVEPPPPIIPVFKEYHIVGSVFNLPCASLKLTVYPPCYSADIGMIEDNSSLPLPRQMISVMELAK